MSSTVYLCTGKDCSRATGHGDLAHAVGVADGVRAVPVRCQKVCKGPVAGVEVDGQVEWFARIRSAKARRSVVALARDGGAVPERLERRRSRKRSGQLRT